MELSEVMRTTGAVREFTDEPVSDELLTRVLDDARHAPSGGNRQGWRVIVVRDPRIRRRIRDLYDLGWREYWAHVVEGRVPFAPGPDGIWRGSAVDLDEARRTTPPPNAFNEHLHEAPVLLVVTVDLGALACLDNGLERQKIVGGGSIYPFVHNMLLAARSVGLGGVITTILCRQEPAVKELLAIPTSHAVAALVVLGHPKRQVTKLRRKSVPEFTVIDRFDGAPFA